MQNLHKMLCLVLNTRKRMIVLIRVEYSSSEIHYRLREDVFVTNHSINRLLQKFQHQCCIKDLSCRKRKKIITDYMRNLIDELMEADGKLTAKNLKSQFVQEYLALEFSLNTIRHACRENGWVKTCPHYCQVHMHNIKLYFYLKVWNILGRLGPLNN